MTKSSMLEEVKANLRSVTGPDGQGWHTALCPFHNDEHKPNLRFRETGFRCMTCHEKGNLRKLADQLGLPAAEEPAKNGLTVAALAAAKNLPEEFLRSLGVTDGANGSHRVPCVDIPYMDVEGEVSAVHKRITMAGNPRFLWRRGDHTCPYGLWQLKEARQLGRITLVEGETDCWTLWQHGIPALGLPGAGTWKSDYAQLFEGLDVFVWCEPDTGGSAMREAVVRDLPGVRVIEPPFGVKDPSALYLSDPASFKSAFEALLSKATPASDLQDEAQTKEAQELYEQGEAMLKDPAILHRLVLTTEALGHVDDRENVAALHLVVISRLLEKVISVVIKGQSSDGKSHLAHKVLEVHPPSAAYILSAMSEHALAYSEQPLAHRFLVLEEAVSLDKRFTTYLVRSLLSEGHLRYETVEKTDEGLRSRLIEREGPTGLISTTTAHSLDAETETRVLTLETREDARHLRHVLRAIADRHNSPAKAEVPTDVTAALGWIELAGDRAVVIRFAGWLADRLPTTQVAARLARDFDSLLAVIGASAILHQCQRDRDENGRIIARIGDYAIAQVTIGHAFDLAVSDSITERQREVYETVQRIPEGKATVQKVAEVLGVHATTAYRHLHALASKGFLLRPDKEQKTRAYVICAKLPEPVEALPAWQEVAENFPSLAESWVNPLTGETQTHVCTAPSNGLQQCNDAIPDSVSTSIASLQSETGDSHTREEGRRRISL